MKKIYLIGLFISFCLLTKAEKFLHVDDKAFNWGARVGFNATFPIINSLSVNGIEAENMHLQYKVGFLSAVFCRINIERMFLQPSLAWHRSEGEILFTVPGLVDAVANTPSQATVDRLFMRSESLELPIMVGYNLVKQGPYGLSLMVGPNLKYNYKVSYTSNFDNTEQELENNKNPFGISISAGVGVSIWRLFFDFIYEFGLNHTESDFKDRVSQIPANNNDITINKHTNVMSFSLGFLF